MQISPLCVEEKDVLSSALASEVQGELRTNSPLYDDINVWDIHKRAARVWRAQPNLAPGVLYGELPFWINQDILEFE